MFLTCHLLRLECVVCEVEITDDCDALQLQSIFSLLYLWHVGYLLNGGAAVRQQLLILHLHCSHSDLLSDLRTHARLYCRVVEQVVNEVAQRACLQESF